MDELEIEKKEKLEQERISSRPLKITPPREKTTSPSKKSVSPQAPKIAENKGANPYNKFKPRMSLLSGIDPLTDWLMLVAIILAISKDIADFVGIGSFPGIGTVVTIGTSTTVFFILLITGASGNARIARSVTKKFSTLAAGTLVEIFFFGINFLPIETIVVCMACYMTIAEKAEEKEREAETERASQVTSASYVDDYNEEQQEAA